MPSLRQSLDVLQKTHERSIESDPIFFPRQFSDPKDQEVVAFISAMFAFGNVKAIFGTLGKIFLFLGSNPHQKMLTFDTRELKSHPFPKHRWITPSDTQNLFLLLQHILREHQSLETSFVQFHTGSIDQTMIQWFDFLKIAQVKLQKKDLSRGQKFLFASPKTKSSSKRLQMFFRWVVRDEYPDLGLWKSVKSSELFIPLDVHLFQFSQHLGFTRKKQANWPAVMEITQAFRKINPQDPIRYDFSLARLGITNLCIHAKDDQYCHPCLLRKHCKLHK